MASWVFLQQASTTKSSKNTKYEKARGPRKVHQHWKQDRPWLEFLGNDVMRCKWCSAHDELKYTWESGRLETLKYHEASSIHQKALPTESVKHAPVGASPAEVIIQKLDDATVDKLKILFRNAHAISLAGRPFTDFVWMAQLDNIKKLNVGNTYINDKSAREFTSAIAATENENILQEMECARYLSILSDGSTDSSVIENEIIFVRKCQEGIIKLFFVRCAQMSKANAPNIVEAMKRAVQHIGMEWPVFVSKLVAMGSDGASVMLGSSNGVAAILRREQPSMVAVHCYAHKLELSYKDTIKEVALHNKVSTCLLQGLYYFYHNSPLNRSNLKHSFASLGLKVLMPTRVGGTRWVGHLLRALINFIASYPALRQHLEQVVNPTERITNSTAGKAKGLLKLMKQRDVIMYVHLMADVLSVLSRLSLIFQERSCSAADIHINMDETLRLLKTYETKEGPYVLKANQLNAVLSDDWDMRQRPEETYSKAKDTLLSEMQHNLKHRFELPNVIEAMKIASFKSWPLPEDTCKIEDFGDESISELTSHYKEILVTADVDPAQAAIEWSSLKNALYTSRPNEIVNMTWERANRMYPEYQNVLSLLDLVLTVPGSSSECERGFRQMKAIKTDVRTSLGEASLSDQLTIKLHAASIDEYDPMPAISFWNRGGKRWPNIMNNEARKKMKTATRCQAEEQTKQIADSIAAEMDNADSDIAPYDTDNSVGSDMDEEKVDNMFAGEDLF